MEIQETEQKDWQNIKIIGDLDASSALQLDDVIKKNLDNNRYKLLIDCAQLNYISSAGLGVFVSYLDDFKKCNGQIIFFHMQPKVLNVFQILGLDKLLTIVGNEQEATALA